MVVCHECSSEFVKKQKDVEINKKDYGSFKVKGVIHYYCENCGSSRIPAKEVKRIESENIKFSTLKILSKRSKINSLELKNILKCDMKMIDSALDDLYSNGKIILNKDKGITEISLPIDKKNGIMEMFKNIFKKEK